MQKPAPGHGGHRSGYGGGQEEQGAENVNPRKGPGHHQGGDQPQEYLHRDHNGGKQKGSPHRAPEGGVLQHLGVIGQANPVALGAQEVFAVKREPEGVQGGPDQKDQQQHQAGNEQKEGLEGLSTQAHRGFGNRVFALKIRLLEFYSHANSWCGQFPLCTDFQLTVSRASSLL